MARVMHRAVTVLAHNAFTAVLTPPVGKKYEVLSVSCGQYLGPATNFQLAENLGGGFSVFLDQLAVAAGVFVVQRSYQSMLIPHPSTFDISELSVGGLGISVVTYMDVDL